MSPTYTMSAHLCKQIYSSWRQGQARQTSPELQVAGLSSSPPTTSSYYLANRAASPEKRSMDSDRSDAPAMSRKHSSSSYGSGGK